MLDFKGKLREHPRYELEIELYCFRNHALSDRLGWGVESHRGLERDGFDKPDTRWVLIEDEEGLCGCIRLLSCAQDYMLPRIFPAPSRVNCSRQPDSIKKSRDSARDQDVRYGPFPPHAKTDRVSI